MEYLVTMTTNVPHGTSEQSVADIRAREAVHTQELARQGSVLRLWRPPLRPGEWRTIGLFSAGDSAELEQVLESMPLRVWRTDEVVALGPHANDPVQPQTLDPDSTEFLTTFVLTIPAETSAIEVNTRTAGEAERTRELAEQHRLIRLWTLPARGHALGLWQAPDGQAMRAILQSLPMADWLSVDTVPLSRHPSDPATGALGGAHSADAGAPAGR